MLLHYIAALKKKSSDLAEQLQSAKAANEQHAVEQLTVESKQCDTEIQRAAAAKDGMQQVLMKTYDTKGTEALSGLNVGDSRSEIRLFRQETDEDRRKKTPFGGIFDPIPGTPIPWPWNWPGWRVGGIS